MTITKPNARDVADLAQRLGYRSALPDAEQYASLISELLDAYDTVETIAARTPTEQRSVDFRVPGPDEDPDNAWRVKTSIRTSATGKLAGRTVAVKDSIMVAGLPMGNGSGLLDGFIAPADATVVARVLDAGGEVTGTTNCEYLCLSGGSHTGHGGETHNPHRHGYAAGGSSSGSAVVLAKGEADLALGADQAGSIRAPASFCGVVGLKPTYGLVPYTGVAPIEPFIDHVGPMSTTVADNALLLSVIAGADGYDSRQKRPPVADYLGALDGGLRGLRIGVLNEGFGQSGGESDVDTTVRNAAADLAKLGAEVVDVSVAMHSIAPAFWTPIGMQGLTRTVLCGQGFGIGRDDWYPTSLMDHLHAQRDRLDELPANIKMFTMAAEYVRERYGQSYYGRAINGVRTLRAAYDAALDRVDVLLMPTTPHKAQPLPGADATVAEVCARATEMFTNTCPFDVTHHPALSVPCGFSDGLPVGLMLVGRHFDESTLYRAAHAYERRDG